jgi:hypothetical protein
MDAPMREAYCELEDEIRKALKAHRGNRSVLSIMLNTLLLYPDHPYGLGTLYGTEFDEELSARSDSSLPNPVTLPKTKFIPRNAGRSKRSRKSWWRDAGAKSLQSTRTSTTLRPSCNESTPSSRRRNISTAVNDFEMDAIQ